jgi:hypothetical protein
MPTKKADATTAALTRLNLRPIGTRTASIDPKVLRSS